jgi:hypothetical protein
LQPLSQHKMSETEKKMQNAIWMDIAAFTSTYPELQRALKYALGALVRYVGRIGTHACLSWHELMALSPHFQETTTRSLFIFGRWFTIRYLYAMLFPISIFFCRKTSGGESSKSRRKTETRRSGH